MSRGARNVGSVWRWARQRLLAPVLRRQGDRLLPRPLRPTPRLRALARLARWWRPHAPTVTYAQSRQGLYHHVLTMLGPPATYLEFGVSRGASLRWWVEHVDDAATTFIGYDSFEGLPTAWGAQPAGSYTAAGTPPPIDDPRVRFEVGRFETTVSSFDDLRHPVVAHLDADLYDSTALVLRALGPHLRPGDLVIFDELLDVGTPEHEFSAYADVAAELRLQWEPTVAVAHGPQVAMIVAAPPGAG